MLQQFIQLLRIGYKGFPEHVLFVLGRHTWLFRNEEPAAKLPNQIETETVDSAEIGLFECSQIVERICFRSGAQQLLPGTTLELDGGTFRISNHDQAPQRHSVTDC